MAEQAPLPASFDLGGRPVGEGHPTYVIAEAGANHNRDLAIARELIDVAAEAGADAVKFQTYSGEGLYSSKTPGFEYLAPISDKTPSELLEEIALPREWQVELRDHAARARDRLLLEPVRRARRWPSSTRSASRR